VLPLVAVWAASHATQAGPVLLVDDDAGPGGDGATWNTAYRFLQDALAFASDPGNGVAEIRVAQGIYRPDRDEMHPDGTGDRDASFELINGVNLCGGYAGIGAPDPDQRDIEANETILSGDLVGDDGPDFLNNAENSFQVVNAVLVDDTAVLDGFSITAGNANGGAPDSPLRYGGGIWNVVATPMLSHCTVRQNSARFGAGVVVINGSHPKLTNVSFVGNRAYKDGGGLFVEANCSVTARGCVFEQNVTEDDDGAGAYSTGPLTLIDCNFVENSSAMGAGGLAVRDSILNPTVLMIGCHFRGNSSNSFGGGISSSTNDLTVVNCVFEGNSANRGGAMSLGGDSMVVNCTIVDNSGNYAGGILSSSPFTTLQNCILWANSPDQIDPNEMFLPIVLFCDVQGGWPGGTNIDADPMFVDQGQSDFHLSLGSPCIDAGLCVPFPSDLVDLDGDGDTAEPVPYDADGEERMANSAVDIGAFEFQGPFGLPGDINGDAAVDIIDFLALLGGWGACCPGDLNGDGTLDGSDLQLMIELVGPCPPKGPCPGDLNGDGQVDAEDLNLLIENFGVCAPCPEGDDQTVTGLIRPCPADVDGNGTVNIVDLLILLGNWG
jgi:predicted outer membrane repeat protein